MCQGTTGSIEIVSQFEAGSALQRQEGALKVKGGPHLKQSAEYPINLGLKVGNA